MTNTAFAGIEASPEGDKLSAEEWSQRKGQWLPTDVDKTHVRSLRHPVYERDKSRPDLPDPQWDRQQTVRL